MKMKCHYGENKNQFREIQNWLAFNRLKPQSTAWSIDETFSKGVVQYSLHPDSIQTKSIALSAFSST
jgi:hypothetical protein